MSVLVRDADLARDKLTLQRFILGSNTYEAQFEADRRLDPGVGEEFLPELVERAQTKQGRIFVAEDGGSVLGWAVCYVDQEDTYVKPDERAYGYVAELFVEEAARGRHIGRTLLKSCEEHFRSIGLKSVHIGALSPNTRAINAYRAAGYANYAVNLRKLL
jgi:ribosomal protein S18 acetylase RimI-like enzyme